MYISDPESSDSQTTSVLIEWRGAFTTGTRIDARARLDYLVEILQKLSAEKVTNGSGILPCIGWTSTTPTMERIGLIFKQPDGRAHPPISLYKRILSDTRKPEPTAPSLGVRFRLALTLARLFGNFMAIGCLHRGVRSHNILFFHDENLSKSYLAGFVESRSEEMDVLSSLINTNSNDYNLYRPFVRPNLPGERPESRNGGLNDDLYDLGVVLLEIGLWKPVHVLQRRAGLEQLHNEVIPRMVDTLSYRTGDIYRDAVSKCLDARKKSPDDSRVEYAVAVVEQLARCCA
jgi:hypothetical protein